MRNLTMMTDLYELTMMNGYLRFGMKITRACFDIFYRKQGDMTAYAVAAGLEQAVEYVKNLHFSKDDIAYLRSLNIFDEAFLTRLSTPCGLPAKFWLFRRERSFSPANRLSASLRRSWKHKLLETALLNIINHQTLIATKASRVVQAARGDGVLNSVCAARRPDAGIYGARAAMIGGCQATSNVLTGQLFGVPVGGTHAHSWVMSFPGRAERFPRIRRSFRKNCLLLVDTYDTLASGVPNAITVFGELRAKGL